MGGQDFQYRKLIVWQKAMQFSKQVYRLVEQFRRASKRDYAHFLSIARDSLYETMTQLEMAKEFGYLESIDEAEILAAEISRMKRLRYSAAYPADAERFTVFKGKLL